MLRMKNQDIVEIFSDGGCSGNPGPGGWGLLIRYQKHEKTFSGSEPYTTNNRMEMMAAIQGLKALKKSCPVRITTDSSYLKEGISSWIEGWKKNGWKTKEKTLVKNIDLWQELDLLINQHLVEWVWVKGHAGHRENEIADTLAQKAIQDYLKQLGL